MLSQCKIAEPFRFERSGCAKLSLIISRHNADEFVKVGLLGCLLPHLDT